AELVELVGTYQQVQRQLLVAKIEADHLGQKLVRMSGQRKLDSSLYEMRFIQALPLLTFMRGEQLLVEKNVVHVRLAFAELFQINTDELRAARITPLAYQSVEPCAVDQLGGRHGLQEMQ